MVARPLVFQTLPTRGFPSPFAVRNGFSSLWDVSVVVIRFQNWNLSRSFSKTKPLKFMKFRSAVLELSYTDGDMVGQAVMAKLTGAFVQHSVANSAKIAPTVSTLQNGYPHCA
jgi:hypothetical protein